MIAISVIEDRFSEIQAGQKFDGAHAGSSRDDRTIRRPTRGITLKEDTFASMRVIAGNGTQILLTDAGGKKGTQQKRQTTAYSNFLLQQVSEERMEKQQILETFGEPYIFLFGERARVVSFSGILLNTFDFNWEAEWWENYELYLRGTRCVENDARVFIAYDQTLVSGYIIASSSSKNTQEPNHVNFQFTLFLTGYSNFSDIGDGTAVPIRARELAKKPPSTNGSFEFSVQGPNATTAQGENGALQSFNSRTPNLFDGITAGLASVMNTWNQAQGIVNNAAQQLSNLAKGDILRVPFGFAGTLAYDSVDVVRDQISPGVDGAYGVVKYSEFKDNKDEYIGTASQYGSSLTTDVLSSDQTLASQTRDQALIKNVSAMWQAAGFLMPSDAEAEVSSFIIRNGVGLLAAGNSNVWQAAETANTGLSAITLTPLEAARSVSPVPIVA